MFSSTALSIAVLLPAVLAAPQAAYYSAPAVLPSPPSFTPPIVPPDGDAAVHGPYSGTPTTVGALTTLVLAASIPALPPNPTATTYPSDGKLHAPEPAPYTPAGGLGTNGTEPVYNAKSDFDYESLVSCPPVASKAFIDNS